MLLAFLVYLIQFLSSLKLMLIVLTISSGAMAFVSFLNVIAIDTEGKYSDSKDKLGNILPRVIAQDNFWRMYMKRSIIAGICLAFIAIMIPSQVTSYTMAAGYITQTIAQSPDSKEIGGKVLTLINSKLDTLITDEINKVVTSTTSVVKKR